MKNKFQLEDLQRLCNICDSHINLFNDSKADYGITQVILESLFLYYTLNQKCDPVLRQINYLHSGRQLITDYMFTRGRYISEGLGNTGRGFQC